MTYVRNSNELAATLRRARQYRGLTQKEVAMQLNIDRSTYTYYELGRSLPSIFQLIKLSKIFNISITYFLINGTPEKDAYFGLQI